jgi:hypothetical protein
MTGVCHWLNFSWLFPGLALNLHLPDGSFDKNAFLAPDYV